MMDGRQEMRNIDIHEWKEEGGRTWKREEEGEEEGGVGKMMVPRQRRYGAAGRARAPNYKLTNGDEIIEEEMSVKPSLSAPLLQPS